MTTPDKSGHTERHHIIPRCMGGTNAKNNLVDLSTRQHFIAHLLLPKMVSGKEQELLVYALRAMANLRNSPKRYIVGSRTYAIIRNHLALIPMSEAQRIKISIALRNRKLPTDHKLHISAGLIGRIQSEDTKEKIRLSNTGKKRSATTRLNIAKSKLGKQLSSVHRENIRAAKIGCVLPDQWCKNISAGQQKFMYSLTSPIGEIFETTNLKTFCAEHSLPYQTFSTQSRKSGTTRSGWVVHRS